MNLNLPPASQRSARRRSDVLSSNACVRDIQGGNQQISPLAPDWLDGTGTGQGGHIGSICQPVIGWAAGKCSSFKVIDSDWRDSIC